MDLIFNVLIHSQYSGEYSFQQIFINNCVITKNNCTNILAFNITSYLFSYYQKLYKLKFPNLS